MTVLDVITLALKSAGIVGVGQPAAAEYVEDALQLANMMLGQWNRRRWLVYHLVDESIISTGAQSYTIGIGGDIPVARPDRIESAFARYTAATSPNQIDYPLALLQSYEDYARIPLKTLSSFPAYAFLDSDFPLGRLYVWPVPLAGQFEIHVLLKDVLTSFDELSDDINLPPEYLEAITYNLAGRLRPHFQLPPDPSITALAKASLNTVRGANAQVPQLRMPRELTRRGYYSILADRYF